MTVQFVCTHTGQGHKLPPSLQPFCHCCESLLAPHAAAGGYKWHLQKLVFFFVCFVEPPEHTGILNCAMCFNDQGSSRPLPKLMKCSQRCTLLVTDRWRLLRSVAERTVSPPLAGLSDGFTCLERFV